MPDRRDKLSILCKDDQHRWQWHGNDVDEGIKELLKHAILCHKTILGRVIDRLVAGQL